MLRKFTLLALAITLAGFSYDVWGQRQKHAELSSSKPSVSSLTERHKLTVGEKLSYSVKLNNVNAARYTIEVADKGNFHGQEGYQLNTKVETVGLIRKTMLEVNDVFITYLDPKTRLPFRAERDIKEGPKQETGTVLFDHKKLKANIDNGAKTVDLRKPTFDVPGLMWALRNLDFKGEKVQKLYGLDAKKGRVFSVEIERLGKETIAVGEKEIEAVQLALRLQDREGKNSDEMQIRIWISNDAQRYPLLITANPPFGEIRVDLVHLPGKSKETHE